MTKRDVLTALQAVPDDAELVFFTGDEDLALATKVRVWSPDQPGYYVPDCFKGRKRSKPTWFEFNDY